MLAGMAALVKGMTRGLYMKPGLTIAEKQTALRQAAGLVRYLNLESLFILDGTDSEVDGIVKYRLGVCMAMVRHIDDVRRLVAGIHAGVDVTDTLTSPGLLAKCKEDVAGHFDNAVLQDLDDRAVETGVDADLRNRSVNVDALYYTVVAFQPTSAFEEQLLHEYTAVA
jgi:hypothetical protein